MNGRSMGHIVSLLITCSACVDFSISGEFNFDLVLPLAYAVQVSFSSGDVLRFVSSINVPCLEIIFNI